MTYSLWSIWPFFLQPWSFIILFQPYQLSHFSPNRPRTLQPESLCTLCHHCLENVSPDSSLTDFFVSLHAAQMWLYQREFPDYQIYNSTFSLPLPITLRPDHFLFSQFWLLAILPELSIALPFCAFTIFCYVLWSLLERLLFISHLTTLLLFKTDHHVCSPLY